LIIGPPSVEADYERGDRDVARQGSETIRRA
jgi:hypothetical protein